MDEIIRKSILLFTLLLTLTVNAQVEQQEEVNDEYKENNSQGGEEETNYNAINLKESDLIGGAWSNGSGSKMQFYSNHLCKMCSTDGKITETQWHISGNNVVLTIDNTVISQIEVTSKETDNLTVTFNGNDLDLKRVSEISYADVNKRSSSSDVNKTKNISKRKVNSPLAITTKNMIGSWKASNGNLFQFYYNYLKFYQPNKPMIDCQWNLNEGNVVLSAYGLPILKAQVISISKTKMTLALETGDLILTKMR
jgi:hypothetical protein